MKQFDNDNDELSFITLGMAVRNVTRFLEGSKEQKEDRERKAPDQSAEKEKADQQREAVNDGLRRIRSFERRYRAQD